jgi:uncharacterized membrane protein
VQPDRAPVEQRTRRESARTDVVVGWTLLAGLVLSVATMALGLILGAIQRDTGARSVLPLDRVFSNLGEGKASAVLDLGILLLFATPVAGVLMALGQFLRQRDLPFVLVATLLLLMLVAGFAVALR